jgi:hypothetical protein
VNVQPPSAADITPLGGAVLLYTPLLAVVPNPENGKPELATLNRDGHVQLRFTPLRVWPVAEDLTVSFAVQV